MAQPILLDFICDRDAPNALGRFWAIAGMYSGEGRTYPSPWGAASTSAYGFVSGVPVWVEIWEIGEHRTRVRLSTDASLFNKSQRRDLLKGVQSQFNLPSEERISIEGLSKDGYSYVSASRQEVSCLTPEIQDLMQEESLALRTDTGSVAMRGVSCGLIDFPRHRLIVVLDHLPVSMGAVGIELYPGGPSAPIEEIPGVLLLQHPQNVFSMNVSSDGKRVATMEYWAGKGHLACLDVGTGQRQLVASLEHIAGHEKPVFSPDGAWILVPGYPGARIVNCSDASVLQIPELTGNACWYELDGKRGLLGIGAGSADDLQPERVVFVDLQTMGVQHVGEVKATDPGLPPLRRYLSDPISGPDGRILVGSAYGPSAEYLEANGSRARVAVLDMASLTLSHPIAPFADLDGVVEREHKMWNWNSQLVWTDPLNVNRTLLDMAEPASRDVEPDPDEYRTTSLLLVDLDSPVVTGNWS